MTKPNSNASSTRWKRARSWAATSVGANGLRRTKESTSRPRSLSGLRRGLREGLEAKGFSAVPAEHDSVGHLLESRCAATTSEVFEALRERACRSIEDADVIEREDLASFSAPLDSFLRVAAHEPGIAGWKVGGNNTEPCSQLPGSELPEQVPGGERPRR